jgi:hypothetical protein
MAARTLGRAQGGGVVKGGDGGVVVPRGGRAGPYADGEANKRVCLTCQADGSLATFETADPSDRAHGVRDGAGNLVPATNRRMVRSSRARRYPASGMTSRGVSHDSAFDELWEREGRLREMGLGRPGQTAAQCVEYTWERACDSIRLRDILEPNRRAYELPSALSTGADAAEMWLARHDPGYWGEVAGREVEG